MLTDCLSNDFSKLRSALVSFLIAGNSDTAANLDPLLEGGADMIEPGLQEMSLSYTPTNLA